MKRTKLTPTTTGLLDNLFSLPKRAKVWLQAIEREAESEDAYFHDLYYDRGRQAQGQSYLRSHPQYNQLKPGKFVFKPE